MVITLIRFEILFYISQAYLDCFKGYIVENAVITLPYGALQIANALKKKLLEANMSPYSFKSPVERLILRYVMEQVFSILLLLLLYNHESNL